MPNMPIARLRADEITGTYWTTPTKATLAEVHPLLMATMIMTPNYKDWSLYSAEAYDMASGGPLGYFDIAFHVVTHRACAYFSAVGSEVVMHKPLWFQSYGDVDGAVQAFYDLVREAGHVD